MLATQMEDTRESIFMVNHERGVNPPQSGKQKRKRNSSPLSYVAVIARAILSSPRQRLPLCDIYKFIEERHVQFTENRPRWRNTVRHNLSLHDCFVRGEVAYNKKGCNWRIHPSFLAEFSRGDFSRHKFSQSPSLPLERRYETLHPLPLERGYETLHGAHFSVNAASPCYICESTRQVLPSPAGMLQFQRQGMQCPQIPHLPWRPWTY